MLCFYGSTTWSVMSRMVAAHLAAGRIGGVVFDASNVGSRQDVIDLVQMFCNECTDRALDRHRP